MSGIKTILFLWLFVPRVCFAEELTFDFQQINLADAIRVIAKANHINVMLASEIKGVTALHLRQVSAPEALDAILTANGLLKTKIHDVWWIAPQEKVIKASQEQTKWLEANEALQPLQDKTIIIHYARAEDIATLLQGKDAEFISKRGGLRVDARTNTLFIRDTEKYLKTIQKMVQSLDVPVKQILIEARLASVDHDCERDLGITFGTISNRNGQHAQYDVGHYSLAVAKLADGNWLDVKLTALEKAGHAHLMSTPSLFTANQQPASIESGEEIPYQEVSESGGTAVVFKKAVLALHVTPQILPGNRILLQLRVNQDRPSDKIVLGVPTISTRQMMTSVVAKSGETVVLGGIYEVDQEEGERGLPLLSRLPGIGVLFKEAQTRRSKRELLIFVTPKIMA